MIHSIEPRPRFAPFLVALALLAAVLVSPATVPSAEAQCTVSACATCPADPTCASCNSGYLLDGVANTCNDINECQANNGGCAVAPSGSCSNTPGSRTCSCSSGYTGNGIICADINECQTNNGGCSSSPPVTCTNTLGSHGCGACPGGYTGNGFTCTDINECQTNNGGCSTGYDCANQPGTSSCADINECATDGVCNAGTCTNDDGAFTCECPTGVTGDTCDINGYVPPDKATALCEQAVINNVAKYVKCITKCRVQKASKALAGKAFDEQACQSGPKSCRSNYDKKMLALVADGTCPACLDETAQTDLADDALAALVGTKGLTYCAGTEPLAP